MPTLTARNFPQLKKLFCRSNHIESMMPFTGLSSLKLLDLANNAIKRIGENEIPQNLVVLNIVGNDSLEYS